MEKLIRNENRWYVQFNSLALQRNMQILGAFSNLGMNRGKTFFFGFIRPAFESLKRRLNIEMLSKYKTLQETVACADELLKNKKFTEEHR